MKSDYQNKLSDLTTEAIKELMWFYYGGMEEKILMTDYHIDLDDHSLLYRTFPLVKDESDRTCPHCKVALLAFQENRASYGQEVFCQECDCVLEELYKCRCEKCIQAGDKVIQAIKQAFHKVELSSGIGLYEAVGIDDYVDDDERRTLRKKDELCHWENIPIARLSECYSSLCFFDAAGMRFHLPAYMLAEIRSPYGSNAHVISILCGSIEGKDASLKDYSIKQFSLLNEKQRDAVVLFLRLCLTRLEYEYDALLIVTALNGYWSTR